MNVKDYPKSQLKRFGASLPPCDIDVLMQVYGRLLQAEPRLTKEEFARRIIMAGLKSVDKDNGTDS